MNEIEELRKKDIQFYFLMCAILTIMLLSSIMYIKYENTLIKKSAFLLGCEDSGKVSRDICVILAEDYIKGN